MAYQYELYDRAGTSLGDITSVCFDKWRTPILNGPQTAGGEVPSWHTLVNTVEADGHPTLCAGYRTLRIRKGGTIVFNGIVWNLEDEGDENECTTKFTAIDPMGAFWPRRVARDADGDFSKPSFMTTFSTGPQILHEILANSITYEGELGLDLGAFATSGVALDGAPVDWPMTIGEIYTLLARTGELDAVITPVDGTGSSARIMGTVDAYNGNFGTDLTATVSLKYAPGSGVGNVSHFKRTEDMSTIMNKFYRFLGPKIDDQHWSGNITADDPTLPDPPETAIASRMTGSRTDLSVFFGIDVFDDDNANTLRAIYQRSWQLDLWVRSLPREMIFLTPAAKGAHAPAGYASFDSSDFGVGDLVSFEASAKTRKATSGAVRVYGLPIKIDDNGDESIDELLVSADQEGL